MKIKKILALVLAFLMLIALSACVNDGENPENPEGNTPDETVSEIGKYVLTKKTVSGANVTENYLYNVLQLSEKNTVKWYETDISGLRVSEGSYELSGNVVRVQIGVRAYPFNYDKAAGTLKFNGKISKKEVVMDFSLDKNYTFSSEKGEVAFTDELFGESADENFYNYCPTVMTEGKDTMHIWYCANAKTGNVTDYVAYRKGTLKADGKWTFTDRQLVLEPTAGTWDARHTCDPSVIKGKFLYKGVDYGYLMAYLGCTTSDNSRNEVGIALAEKPEGPWIKPSEINPIANYYENDIEYNVTSWGYGQPSLVSADKEGKIILFYSKGIPQGTYTYAEMWDLSDLSAPKKLKEGMVSNIGVTNAGGGTDVINNADFAYDPATKRFYCVKEDFPYPTDGGVNWIAGSNTVMYMESDLTDVTVGDTFFKSATVRWTVFDKITSARTGFARNHNCGIVTDGYGWLTDPAVLPIVYTMSKLSTDFPNWNAGGQWPALHTYRLHGTIVEI